jgi:hypothetical protein
MRRLYNSKLIEISIFKDSKIKELPLSLFKILFNQIFNQMNQEYKGNHKSSPNNTLKNHMMIDQIDLVIITLKFLDKIIMYTVFLYS